MTDPRRELGRASERYRDTWQRHEQARLEVIAAVVAALRAGVPPTEVATLCPFSPAYVRKIAREHDVPPAPVGLKPRTQDAAVPNAKISRRQRRTEPA